MELESLRAVTTGLEAAGKATGGSGLYTSSWLWNERFSTKCVKFDPSISDFKGQILKD